MSSAIGHIALNDTLRLRNSKTNRSEITPRSQILSAIGSIWQCIDLGARDFVDDCLSDVSKISAYRVAEEFVVWCTRLRTACVAIVRAPSCEDEDAIAFSAWVGEWWAWIGVCQGGVDQQSDRR